MGAPEALPVSDAANADAPAGDSAVPVPAATAPVQFRGRRGSLLLQLLRGFLLFVPTLGIYRFWLATWKRRFYWAHTVIDGDSLEYTGSAVQLLVGFVIAVLIFVPLYGFFFYLSLQGSDIAVYGYAAVGVFMYFLSGYAIFRSRRFRLTRTLWRGIRFHQSGNAWGYALRRFGWTLLMILTLGLCYPGMASNLWRYRIGNTWFGDRRFAFSGSWKTLALPFYLTYLIGALLLIGVGVAAIGLPTEGQIGVASLAAIVPYLGFLIIRSREVTRFGSCVTAGDAGLTVKLRARSLLFQHIVYGLVLGGTFLVFGTLGLFAIGVTVGESGQQLPEINDMSEIFRLGLVNLVLIIAAYFAVLALWSIVSELVLAFGFWKIVARGSVISNPQSLQSVRSSAADESPLAGEGLADALNVGAY